MLKYSELASGPMTAIVSADYLEHIFFYMALAKETMLCNILF